MRENLNADLKEFIVNTLRIEDVRPEEIGDDEPLFGVGLGLDSIDGLELVVALEKKYDIKIGSSEESRRALQTVNALARFMESQGVQTS